MTKLKLIQKIKDVYQKGENMMEFLRSTSDGKNDIESIMISYDFQAGSYIEIAAKNEDYINRYTNAIIAELKNLAPFKSIMEVGVGEATLMSPLMKKLDPNNDLTKLGFDISWSRVRYGLQHAAAHQQQLNLFVGNLFEIPLPDNSVDVLYTSHSLEPNGGAEKAALAELYRVASKYIVLLEPDYEGGNAEVKHRIEKHGYVKHLAQHATELGYNVITNRPFEVFINPLNPTRLTIIKKDTAATAPMHYCCPVTKTPLEQINNNWYSKESGLLYPNIDGVPCLIEQQALLATHYQVFNK
ncbi:MAG: methyltransferase domain-containing protein [Bacteroidetes bacterium]|nr:MAG: methyltransferase domain-containing protein [Bacteroidota bacterium]